MRICLPANALFFKTKLSIVLQYYLIVHSILLFDEIYHIVV